MAFDFDLRGREVLITGSSGFMGRHLAARVASSGAHVRLFSRTVSSPVSHHGAAQIVVLEADIRDHVAVDKAVAGVDMVFHLAGRSGPAASNREPAMDLDVNLHGLLSLLDACARQPSPPRVVFPSSRLVYAPHIPPPVTEGAPLLPASIYGVHKLAAEHYLRLYDQEHGVRSVALRITNPFGAPAPGTVSTNYGLANWFFERAVRDQSITVFGDGQQIRDYIYVADAIDAMIACAVSPNAAGRTFNVGSGVGTPLSSMAQLIVGTVGRGRVVHLPWPDDAARVESGDFVADLSAIRAEVGWSPRTTLTDGVAIVARQLQHSAR